MSATPDTSQGRGDRSILPRNLTALTGLSAALYGTTLAFVVARLLAYQNVERMLSAFEEGKPTLCTPFLSSLLVLFAVIEYWRLVNVDYARASLARGWPALRLVIDTGVILMAVLCLQAFDAAATSFGPYSRSHGVGGRAAVEGNADANRTETDDLGGVTGSLTPADVHEWKVAAWRTMSKPMGIGCGFLIGFLALAIVRLWRTAGREAAAVIRLQSAGVAMTLLSIYFYWRLNLVGAGILALIAAAVTLYHLFHTRRLDLLGQPVADQASGEPPGDVPGLEAASHGALHGLELPGSGAPGHRPPRANE